MPDWHCCCGHCGKDPRDPKCGQSGGHCRDKFLLKKISQSLLAACDLGSEMICLSIYPSICDTLTPSSGILSSVPLPFQGTGKRVRESGIQQRRAGGTVSHPTLPKQLFAEECLAVLACACEPGSKMLSLSIYIPSVPHYIHPFYLRFDSPYRPLPSPPEEDACPRYQEQRLEQERGATGRTHTPKTTLLSKLSCHYQSIYSTWDSSSEGFVLLLTTLQHLI
jgi:hypothetical protein